MGPQNYFILIYDMDHQTVDIKDFGVNRDGAADAYTEYERDFRGNDRVEVVLVGADSIETIKTTHSHYFARTEEELFERFLTGVLGQVVNPKRSPK